LHQILPSLAPKSFEGGADLLGAHVEGPYLAASRKGAHDSSLFHAPDSISPEDLYGADNLRNSVKMITLAPELPGSVELISNLTHEHKKIVSLGHSAADYDCGVRAVEAGAKTMTHVFNAMNPLHHRLPGLAGLMSSTKVHYSVIPDGIHLHSATLALAFRANAEKCILITDSIEMAGLPDGVYPGHSQIPRRQRKEGNKVTIDGTDTLIGSCTTLDQCVRNLVKFSNCELSEAVRCVTENVANLMGQKDRGMLQIGRRADFVVLSDEGEILQTWVRGKKAFDRTAVDSADDT
jgi:N-acetylglucosamine-6-phosphate deacetylase